MNTVGQTLWWTLENATIKKHSPRPQCIQPLVDETEERKPSAEAPEHRQGQSVLQVGESGRLHNVGVDGGGCSHDGEAPSVSPTPRPDQVLWGGTGSSQSSVQVPGTPEHLPAATQSPRLGSLAILPQRHLNLRFIRGFWLLGNSDLFCLSLSHAHYLQCFVLTFLHI